MKVRITISHCSWNERLKIQTMSCVRLSYRAKNMIFIEKPWWDSLFHVKYRTLYRYLMLRSIEKISKVDKAFFRKIGIIPPIAVISLINGLYDHLWYHCKFQDFISMILVPIWTSLFSMKNSFDSTSIKIDTSTQIIPC